MIGYPVDTGDNRGPSYTLRDQLLMSTYGISVEIELYRLYCENGRMILVFIKERVLRDRVEGTLMYSVFEFSVVAERKKGVDGICLVVILDKKWRFYIQLSRYKEVRVKMVDQIWR